MYLQRTKSMLLIPSYSPRTTIVKNSLRNIGLRPLAWRLRGKTLAATAPPLPSVAALELCAAKPATAGMAAAGPSSSAPSRPRRGGDGEMRGRALARSWRQGSAPRCGGGALTATQRGGGALAARRWRARRRIRSPAS